MQYDVYIALKSKYLLQKIYNGYYFSYMYNDGFVQDYSNSIANAMELLQSCINPSI